MKARLRRAARGRKGSGNERAQRRPRDDRRRVEQRVTAARRLESAFQPAWRRPAPRTASVTPSESSISEVRRAARLPAWHEVRERRRRRAGDLGEVVPQAHVAPRPRVRLRDERVGFSRREHAALQHEAALRVGRQRVVVVGARRAQVALGVDVQLDRREHVVVEQPAQERQRGVLVQVVDAAQRRRIALVVQQMAEVVQQRGGDRARARRPRPRRAWRSAARARAA